MLGRRLLERLSRDRILRRRLPDGFGGRPILVTPDASLRYWRRNLGAVAGDLLRQVGALVRPGMCVWDVGANVGVFTFASAIRAGRQGQVIAVEPDPFLANMLNASTRLGPPDEAPVMVVPTALADRRGLGEFHLAARGRAASHLSTVGGSSQSGGRRGAIRVVQLTLDDLLEWLPPPNLLKIDVETAEALVLRGGSSLFARHRPVVLCEVSPENAAEVTDILAGHGYVLHDAADPAHAVVASAVWETLALPPAHGLGPAATAGAAPGEVQGQCGDGRPAGKTGLGNEERR